MMSPFFCCYCLFHTRHDQVIGHYSSIKVSTRNIYRHAHRMISNSIYDVIMNMISDKLINLNSVNNYHK